MVQYVLYCISVTDAGLGHHYDTLTAHEAAYFRLLYVITVWPGVLGLALPKLAVVGLICRVFKPDRWHRIVLWFIGILCTLNFIVVCMVGLLQCQPIQAQWDLTIKGAKCIDPLQWVHYNYYAACRSNQLT